MANNPELSHLMNTTRHSLWRRHKTPLAFSFITVGHLDEIESKFKRTSSAIRVPRKEELDARTRIQRGGVIICIHSFAETRFEPVARAGEKDNWHITAFASEALLEFETIQVRRRYIKDETARNGGSRTGEEFVGGCERLRLPASGADQQLDPTHTKVSTNTFVQYTRVFSCRLIATVIPSEDNLATDSSSEGSSQ
jgi:hypothetical protein